MSIRQWATYSICFNGLPWSDPGLEADLAKALVIKPNLTDQGWKDLVWCRYPADLERELHRLRMAGLTKDGDP